MQAGHRVFFGLGTNLGDRQANLAAARQAIMREIGPLEMISSLYATAPWGLTDQPEFLNQVVQGVTALEPATVLEGILRIEQDLGRTRHEKWGERLIDIDLLFYDDLIWESPTLIIPHPFIAQRNFVLAPLVEIAPDFIHPVHQQSLQQLLATSPDSLPVLRLGE